MGLLDKLRRMGKDPRDQPIRVNSSRQTKVVLDDLVGVQRIMYDVLKEQGYDDEYIAQVFLDLNGPANVDLSEKD